MPGVDPLGDPRLEALRQELVQARRHLGGVLGLRVPIEPEDGTQPEQALVAELAQQAERLHRLATDLAEQARRVAERSRRVEADLHGERYPTV